jgi:hypothetical protein
MHAIKRQLYERKTEQSHKHITKQSHVHGKGYTYGKKTEDNTTDQSKIRAAKQTRTLLHNGIPFYS